jgi:branched-chain amino acid transport system permease protein
MRIVNLAHPILIISGSFVSYWLFILIGLDPILSLPLAALVVAVLGLLIYKMIFEKNAAQQTYSEMTVLLTFGTAMVIDGILSFVFHNTQRTTSPSYATEAIFIGDIFIPLAQLYSGLVSSVIIVGLAVFLKYSDFGIAIRATSQNWEWIAIMMSLVVLGGMGSLKGAVIGALVLSVVSSMVGAFFSPAWSTMVFFLSLFLILIIRPRGLFGIQSE